MIKIETRKAQLTGGSTIIVSLPKRWVRTVGIKPGDSVSLMEQDDGTLIVSPYTAEKRIRETDIRIDPDTEPAALTRRLIGKYLAGYDRIRVYAKERITAEQRKEAHRTARILIGPEITEETAKHIIIQDILDPSELSIGKVLRRMHLIASSMCSDALIVIQENDPELARDLIQRDDDVDRLYLLVAKQLGLAVRKHHPKKIGCMPVDCMDYRVAAKSIERVADHAERIAYNFLKLENPPVKITRSIVEVGRQAENIYKQSVKALLTQNTTMADKAIDMRNTIENDLQQLLKKFLKEPAETSINFALVLDSIRRIGDHGTDIAEIAINQAVSRK